MAAGSAAWPCNGSCARESEVLEADDRPGGLCRTFWKDGFGYDIGGHILFSKHEEINKLVDGILGQNSNHCRRANSVLFRGAAT